MLDHARLFLTRVMPEGIGEGAYLNIHWAGLTPEGKKFWDGRATASIDEAIRTISWVNGLGDKDIYVCMSLQSQCEKKTSKRGNEYKKALRLADTAVALKSLFVDIDVKPEAYPTTQDALAALQGFLANTGLPVPSAVVMSGSGGFHCHWSLDRTMSREEWQILANRLAAATLHHGLITDSQCTIDSARILRVPGTKNFKHAVPAEVTLLSCGEDVSYTQVASILEAYKDLAVASPPRRTGPSLNDDLGANMPVARLPITLPAVAAVCPFIGETVRTGGADNSQPLWFMTAAVSVFLEEGVDALHAMSLKHPGYVPADTQHLFDRVAEGHRSRDLGWPKCSKIALSGAKECANCPLLAQDKSPLHHAVPDIKKGVGQDDTLPKQFARDADGIINVRSVDDHGQSILIPICHYPIYDAWLSNNPWTLHVITAGEHRRPTTVEIPTEVIGAKDGFNKYMSSRGFFLTEKQYKLMKEFFVAWMQQLQQHKEKVISSSPFGWSVVDSKIEGFAYGGRVWMPTGDRPAASPNAVLQAQYAPKGDIKIWKEAAEVVYSQRRPALDAILAVAFAAPLVRFTGFPGLILNAYSPESGIGKTTAMKVAQSVWANPVLAMQGLNDTTNAVLGKAGQIRHIPMLWDEIKSDAQIKRFCSIVFELTGGREKARMQADTSLRMSGQWQTMLVSASNDSLIDGMAREAGSTTAGLHRLFEYVVEKPAQVTHDIGYVQRLLGRLDDNFGHVGMDYARFLGEAHERIADEVGQLQSEIMAEVKAHQEERLWASTIAVLLRGASYANERGYTDIDIDGLKVFLMAVLERMRGEVKESPTDLTTDLSVSAVLAELLAATRARNTLITNRIWVAKGKPQKNAIQVRCDTSRLDEIVVQIGKEDKLVRISSVFLTRWMGERGYSRHTFVSKLEKEFGLQKLNGKLGGGTDLSCATEHLLELDANHPKLSQLLDV